MPSDLDAFLDAFPPWATTATMEDVSYFAAGPSSAATSGEARHALMRVVAAIVKGQGYDGIESSAMAHILNSLESCEWMRCADLLRVETGWTDSRCDGCSDVLPAYARP